MSNPELPTQEDIDEATEKRRLKEGQARYDRAVVAVNTGVAQLMAADPNVVHPQHLRTGINSAHVTNQAIAELMIEAGVFTQADYIEKLAECMEREHGGIALALSRIQLPRPAPKPKSRLITPGH